MTIDSPSPLSNNEKDLLLSLSDSERAEWLTQYIPAEHHETILQQLPLDDAAPRPWIVSSRGLVAEFFSVSTQTIKEWKSNGMPGSAGKWNLKDIRAWQDLRREENSQMVGDKFSHVKGAILEETHRGSKLKNDATALQLVSADGMRRVMVAWAVKLRSRIMSIPADIVLLVPGELKAAVMRTAEDLVRVALKEAYETQFTDEQVQVLIVAEAKRLTEDDSDGGGNIDRE